MAQLNVVASLKAKTGREKELASLLTALVAPSRLDAGFISYDLHQGLDDSSLFVFYETWQSRDLLDKHMQSPHFKTFEEKVGALVESVEVKLLGKIS